MVTGPLPDNLTGLMWLRDAECFGNMSWQDALDTVAAFNADSENFSCGGYAAGYSDWRLPNRKELYSLMDFSHSGPALPDGQPFLNVQPSYYWASTSYASYSNLAWAVGLGDGSVYDVFKPLGFYVWPVRAGRPGTLVRLDIHANGSDGPVTVSTACEVSIDITLNPGNQTGEKADWWVAVKTPFAEPQGFYSYVHPKRWLPGIRFSFQGGLFDLSSFEVLRRPLPKGTYTFYFGLNDPDGVPTKPWWALDSVSVHVIEDP